MASFDLNNVKLVSIEFWHWDYWYLLNFWRGASDYWIYRVFHLIWTQCDLYNSSYKHIISWFCLLAACTDWALEILSHWSCLNVISDASKAKVLNRGFCEDCGMVVRVEGYPQSLVVLRIGEGNWTFSQEAPHKEELQMCQAQDSGWPQGGCEWLCGVSGRGGGQESRKRRQAQGGAVNQNGRRPLWVPAQKIKARNNCLSSTPGLGNQGMSLLCLKIWFYRSY